MTPPTAAAPPDPAAVPSRGEEPGPAVAAAPGWLPYPRFAGLSRPAVVALVGALAVAVLAAMASGTLTIFLIGALIVYLIDPPISWMHRHRVPRWLGTIIMLAILLAGLAALVILVANVLVTEGAQFANQLPSWIAQLQERAAASDLPPGVKEAFANVGDSVQKALAGLDWGGVLTAGVQTAFGFLGTIFSLTVIPFFVFFVAKDRPALTGSAMRMVPEPWRGDVARVSAIAVSDLGLYIRAQLVIVGVVASAIFVGLHVISFTVDPTIGEFALFLAVFAGFMELIPNFGPYIGMIPAIVVALTISPAVVVLVALLFVGVAFLEGQILVPVIQGRQVSLHPGWIMVLILSGAAIAGILGAIIAVPVAITARDVYRYLFRRAAGTEAAPVIDDAGRIVVAGGPFQPGEPRVEAHAGDELMEPGDPAGDAV